MFARFITTFVLFLCIFLPALLIAQLIGTNAINLIGNLAVLNAAANALASQVFL
jgi:hypothetical protein